MLGVHCWVIKVPSIVFRLLFCLAARIATGSVSVPNASEAPAAKVINEGTETCNELFRTE